MILYNFVISTFKARAILAKLVIVGSVSLLSILLKCPFDIPVNFDNVYNDIFLFSLISLMNISTLIKPLFYYSMDWVSYEKL